MPQIVNSLTGGRSSPQSTKRTKVALADEGAGERWTVKLHREVAKRVAEGGLSNPDFSPTLANIFSELENNPKQFPKKLGALSNTRAAKMRFRNVTYRLVYTLDETARVVKILSIDAHDQAYIKAARRR